VTSGDQAATGSGALPARAARCAGPAASPIDPPRQRRYGASA
jgi:hypothetical protein